MLAGYPPFYDDNPLGIYQKIMDGYYEFPPHIEPKARDLIKSFLCADRAVRLGCTKVTYFLNLTNCCRAVQMMSKLISGSEESTGTKSSHARSLLPGCQKSETPQTLSTSTDTRSKQRLQQCLLKNNRSTLPTSDRRLDLYHTKLIIPLIFF
jgi:hypothetical protein